MTRSRPARSTAALSVALTLALSLGGCVTLFPKAPPAQLYRFGVTATPAAPTGPQTVVQAGMIDFDPAAAGDRMLTADGAQVAYVADARWESPASALFEQALDAGFGASGRVRLVGVGAAKAPYRLRLDVSRFETDYPGGKGAAPTVTIRLHATLERQKDLSLVAEQDFDAAAPADADRLGPIVAAYNAATTKVVGDLVTWVEQTAPPS